MDTATVNTPPADASSVDVPSMKEVAADPKLDQSKQKKPSLNTGRVGEGGPQRNGVKGPQQPQGFRPRPAVIPGKIEEPTRQNVFVPPSSIFFTQRSIPSHFADGKSLQETFDMIAKREIRKRDLPMIDVVWKEGAYWTLSNRRLAVFSELQRRNLAKQVKINIVPFQDRYHAHLEPFFAFWRKRQQGGGASAFHPVPGGMPEGWGGEAPVFSPNLTGEITVTEKSTPMVTGEGALPSSPGKSLPPLVKLSSSEDENVGQASTQLKRPRNSDVKPLLKTAIANGAKRASAAAAATVVPRADVNNNNACSCNHVVNVVNKARRKTQPLSSFFLLNRPSREYDPSLKKPAEVKSEFVCGCGHGEATLERLGKHKDRTGHACWNNESYDSLRDLILNEDLRISMGGGSDA